MLAVHGYDRADADALLSALDVVTQDRTVLLGGHSGDVSAALGWGPPRGRRRRASARVRP